MLKFVHDTNISWYSFRNTIFVIFPCQTLIYEHTKEFCECYSFKHSIIYLFIYLFIYNIRRHARQIQYWANNKLKDCLKKPHQNQKQEKKKITHKKYKNMPNKQKQQNKIAGKRQKQNWLKKVGVEQNVQIFNFCTRKEQNKLTKYFFFW